MKHLQKLILISSSLFISLTTPFIASAATKYITPTTELGAKVFGQRCTICHGNVGMGDGILPRTVKGYPDTNLRSGSLSHDENSLREAIIYGGEKGTLNELMPPFGDELTWLEIESVVKFMNLYYKDTEKALALISENREIEEPNRTKGRAIFRSRCILCHGAKGDGKGKMSKIIKNPPPFDLRKSRMPDSYLLSIITKGGAAMGRSPKMPVFGEELSKSDIGHLIAYIKTFRE